jgi:hypothetical protein
LKVKLEFLPGCAAEDAPTELVLTHPGVEAVDTFLSQQRQGSRASLHLLRLALPPAVASEDFLRRLDPFFIAELKLALLKLVGVHPAD